MPSGGNGLTWDFTFTSAELLSKRQPLHPNFLPLVALGFKPVALFLDLVLASTDVKSPVLPLLLLADDRLDWLPLAPTAARFECEPDKLDELPCNPETTGYITNYAMQKKVNSYAYLSTSGTWHPQTRSRGL